MMSSLLQKLRKSVNQHIFTTRFMGISGRNASVVVADGALAARSVVVSCERRQRGLISDAPEDCIVLGVGFVVDVSSFTPAFMWY